MAGYLEDLDELILKCRNNLAREYIRESVACYRAEAYRSAIVSCWVAVCFDLIGKIRELSLAGDKQAEEKIVVLDAIHRDNDTNKSMKFEREILEFARDKLELISALEYADLDRILKDRHRCAHPSLNADGEQYAPPAELARLHIHSAVTHLLQHEPAQGKFALDRIISQLHSKYFPSGREEVLKAFHNSPIRRARPSLVKNFISVLVKELMLEEAKDYTHTTKLVESMHAVFKMHRKIYEERCAEILPDVMSRVSDGNLHQATTKIVRIPSAWESLGETQQSRLTAFVQRLPTQHFVYIDRFLDFSPLKDAAVRRVEHASIKDLDEIIPFITPVEIINRTIELYHRAKSFNEANRIAHHLKLFLGDLSFEQIDELLSKVTSNDEIIGSFEFPSLLDRIRDVAAVNGWGFDELLRKHELEDYCEPVSDGDAEIPF